MRMIDTITGQEHDKILHAIYKEDYFFRASYEQLARHFLGNFIDKIFSISYEELRKQVAGLFSKPVSLPENENEFYLYICRQYLDLDKLPATVMLNYFNDSIADLKILEIRIKGYEEEIKTIADKEPGLKTEEDTYQYRILVHYKEANQSAEKEIMHFLFHRIKEYSLFNSTNRIGVTSLIYAGIPYSFRVLANQLRWEALSDLGNKFLELTIEEHQEMQRLYKEDAGVFYAKASVYISDKRIVEKIQGMIAGNHCLNRRRRIFDEAFEAYNKGHKYLFCSVIGLQIEGLFADYCIELGVEESSIRSGSLTDKVRMASRKNNRFRSFEYYAFRFPLIRNQIAHGNIITTDVEQLSDYLLLDLFDVCLSLTSMVLPVNKVVSILRQWTVAREDKRIEVKFSLFREIEVPAFYNLTLTDIEIKESIIDRPFWDYLLMLIETEQPMLLKGVLKIVTILRRNSVNPLWWKEIFDALKDTVADGFDEQQFMEELNYMPAAI